MKTSKTNKTRQMIELALLIAIVIVMAIVPYTGYISIGVISVTLMHIPVLIAGLRHGVGGGFILGLAFGLTSLFVALTRPMAVTDYMFINPLVSILPRVIFGTLCGLMRPLLKKWMHDKISMFVTAFACTLLHTGMVMTMLYIVYFKDLVSLGFAGASTTLFIFLGGFVTVALMESIVGAAVTVPVVSILERRK